MILKSCIVCRAGKEGTQIKDVQPEDIEDVTGRYLHMFIEERNSDSVSRVRTRINETPFFIVSLIEHKSNVDYNVVMQVFRYMVIIWEDYEKEMEKLKERSMGELFAHFEGWDVQAIRKESYEEALIELRETAYEQVWEEMQEEIESTRKEVTQQVTESDIQKLLVVLRKLDCPRETAIEQLIEQYQLTHETAAAKVNDLWERSL